MTRAEKIFINVQEALTLFSEKLTKWVIDVSCDNENESVCIKLDKEADRSLFCSLLYATGLFHLNDELIIELQ